MRYALFPIILLLTSGLFFLATACADSGLAVPPTPASPLPPVTPLPAATLPPPATALPTPTPEAVATELAPGTPLPSATELPTSTPLPVMADPPAATELPTAEPAEVAPILPPVGPPTDPSQPSVTIGETTWPVELAITPAERSQGLSGREVLPQGSGMLFIFEGDQHLAFWMPDMNFPLDMVWIDSGCHVVDATLNAPVPEPGQSLADLPRFSPGSPARFVLEINAGEFPDAGLTPGDQAIFGGALEGQYGC